MMEDPFLLPTTPPLDICEGFSFKEELTRRHFRNMKTTLDTFWRHPALSITIGFY